MALHGMQRQTPGYNSSVCFPGGYDKGDPEVMRSKVDFMANRFKPHPNIIRFLGVVADDQTGFYLFLYLSTHCLIASYSLTYHTYLPTYLYTYLHAWWHTCSFNVFLTSSHLCMSFVYLIL